MTSYESGAPRVTCAIAAIAMTAITIGVMVVLPAKMEPDREHHAQNREEMQPCVARGSSVNGGWNTAIR